MKPYKAVLRAANGPQVWEYRIEAESRTQALSGACVEHVRLKRPLYRTPKPEDAEEM